MYIPIFDVVNAFDTLKRMKLNKPKTKMTNKTQMKSI